MRKRFPPIEFLSLPERDDAYVYTITNEVSKLPEYGRLLPLVNYFRQNLQYRVSDDAAAVVEISGPTTTAQIEERFLLPPDLNFDQRNKHSVTISDGEMSVIFRPRKSWWLSVGSAEFYDGRDSTTGNHTRHWA